MPANKSFSLEQFIDSWNTDKNTDRPAIGSYDDLYTVDLLLSELLKYERPSKLPFLTKYLMKIECYQCKNVEEHSDWPNKNFSLIPRLTFPSGFRRSGRSISAQELMTSFLTSQVTIKCRNCSALNQGKMKTIKGTYTLVSVDCRGYPEEDQNEDGKMENDKIQTRIVEMRKRTLADDIMVDLVSTINHQSSSAKSREHWVTYSQVEDKGIWYLNSDAKKAKQTKHPLKLNYKDETVDLMAFKTKY